MGWDQIYFVCRNSSGPKQRSSVVLGAVMVSPSEPFEASRGGGPLSSLMFNVCVDYVVRVWLQQVLGDNTACDGVKEAVHNYCIAFFVENGLVTVRCPVWLQLSFDILIKLFKRINLLANSDKTKVVTCMPGRIRVARTEVEYANQQARNTTTSKRHRVECEVCGTSLATGSLRSHLETQHDIFWSFVLNRDIIITRPKVVYRATQSLHWHLPLPGATV